MSLCHSETPHCNRASQNGDGQMANDLSATKCFFIMTNNSQSQSCPCILACGYRQVLIPKSGRKFPAWLIAFDDALVGTRTSWRSKHDIWLLQRSATTSIEFPKAMFAKLADAAPWRAPSSLLTDNDLVNGRLDDDNAASQGDNWHRQMHKNLLRANQFLQSCSKSQTQCAIDAWKVFSRLEDCENLVPTGSEADDTNGYRAQQASHELGQYFCSPENASSLVETCLQRLDCLLQNSQGRELVLVEPSVGRGDIVAALQNHLKDHAALANHSIRVQGFDLDAAAIQHCRTQFDASDMRFECCNFLETKRQDHVATDDACVAFLGGPPYSANHGHGSNMDRDIPIRFVEHAASEWNAQLVFFLMPARCRACRYEALPEGYKRETLDLPSSTFYFQGKQPVTQPSVLQCFWIE